MKRLSNTVAPRVPSEKRGRFQHLLSSLTRFRLVPTDEGFFDLFSAAAANARECADEVEKMLASFSDAESHYEKIKTFERRGDELTVELLRRLDASFVVPYDREDIHALTEELDDVVDDMFAAASLIALVQPETALPEVADLAEVLVAMTDELVALMGCLTNGSGARHRLERIEHLERQGDVIYRRSIGRLFNGEYDALEVMKWKDIVQSLEDSLNAIEDVSDVVESILVKNS
jgi:predicted phosphate transport protein (TIGR00153 family)